MKPVFAALCAGAVLGASSGGANVAHTAGRQQPARQGAISGVVRAAPTGRPLADAAVHLDAVTNGVPARRPAVQLTDELGRFVFTGVAASGTYTLRASKTGYLDGAYGAPTSRPTTDAWLEIRDGEWFSTADITLWRLGGVSGTVVDDRGEPVAGAFVRVLSVLRFAGRDHLAGGPITVTDDRGAYRVGELPPGRYIAMVLRGVHPPALSNPPSALHSAPILEVGDELRGVDVRLPPRSSHSISGVVQGPPEALARYPLRLLADGLESLGPGSEVAVANVAADGSFRFSNVPDGTYTIDATVGLGEFRVGPTRLFYGPQLDRPEGLSSRGALLPVGPPGSSYWEGILRDRQYWARVRVSMNGDDVNALVVPLRPSGTLTVNTAVDVDPARPMQSSTLWSVFLDPASGNPSLGRPRHESRAGDGATVQLTGILPERYVFRTESRGMIKSVVAGGKDVTENVFDATGGLPFSTATITFTDAVPTLAGHVESRIERPVAVLAFPVNRDRWTDYGVVPDRIKVVLSSNIGTFRIATLRAGEYCVVALPADRYDSWTDPDFLARASAVASRVTLRWGETTTIPLRLVDVR